MNGGEQPVPLDPIPRAILFDLDDTLCDYASARELRLRKAFSLDGSGNAVQRSEAELSAMVAASIRMHPHGVDHFPDLFSQFGVNDPTVAEMAGRWYRTHRFHGLELFAASRGVLQAVRHLQGRAATGAGRPVGIITNGPTAVQRAKLDLLQLHGLVDFVVISEEFGASKPDRRIFEEALRRANVDPAEAVFVGDSPEFDMIGAIDIGMATIWVNRSLVAWNHGTTRPDRVIRSVAEVPALVGSV